MELNEIRNVVITDLDHQGRGITRVDNIITFVPDVLPLEEVTIKITNIKKNYLEGEVINIIKDSPRRVKPICPYYDLCGGCDLMILDYEDQAKYKEDKIKNIMKRYASLDCVKDIVKCDNPINYRNKVTFQVDTVIGMYKKKSYSIVPIDGCLLADVKINKTLEKLKKIDLFGIKQIIVRASFDDIMTIFICDADVNINCSNIDGSVIKKYKEIYTVLKGNNYIVDKIGDKKYKISPSSFFQVNSNMTKKLYDKVVSYLELDGSENILDLYCGTGTIGIYLADKVKNVLGVEINKDAIMDAKENAKMNNVTNAIFLAGDASKIVKSINFKPDKIVVDPPRAGLDRSVVDKIIEMNPERIVYVSCDPITLARDLNFFKEKYNIKEITPVDMFCHTMHVESICALERK